MTEIRPEIRFFILELHRLKRDIEKLEDAIDRYTYQSDSGLRLYIASPNSIVIQKFLDKVELTVEEVEELLKWLSKVTK